MHSNGLEPVPPVVLVVSDVTSSAVISLILDALPLSCLGFYNKMNFKPAGPQFPPELTFTKTKRKEA
jgi:hypothetical protein